MRKNFIPQSPGTAPGRVWIPCVETSQTHLEELLCPLLQVGRAWAGRSPEGPSNQIPLQFPDYLIHKHFGRAPLFCKKTLFALTVNNFSFKAWYVKLEKNERKMDLTMKTEV